MDPAGKGSRALAHCAAPNTCEICSATLALGEYTLCTSCLAALPRTGFHRIPFNEIHRRLGHSYAVDQAAGWFYYTKDTDLAQIMVDAKYNSRPSLVRDLARKYADELTADTNFFAAFDVLVPAPMHWLRQVRRGYNQAYVICKGLAEVTGLPIIEALRAPLSHGVQSRQTRLSRYLNLQGTLSLSPTAVAVRGKRVLIVDDIITTGATMRECVRTLAAATPATTSVLALAVTR